MRLGLAVILGWGMVSERRGVYRYESGKRYGERREKQSMRTRKKKKMRMTT